MSLGCLVIRAPSSRGEHRSLALAARREWRVKAHEPFKCHEASVLVRAAEIRHLWRNATRYNLPLKRSMISRPLILPRHRAFG